MIIWTKLFAVIVAIALYVKVMIGKTINPIDIILATANFILVLEII